MWQVFVEKSDPKTHSFKNHVEGFVSQLKLNTLALAKRDLKKREVYVVSYGMNSGSEINGDRPSIVFKSSHSTLGEDITVIPLTSALWQKQKDKYDVFVAKNETNKLYQDSFARLRQIRCISLKRIGRLVGTITDDEIKSAIDHKMEVMLGLELK